MQGDFKGTDLFCSCSPLQDLKPWNGVKWSRSTVPFHVLALQARLGWFSLLNYWGGALCYFQREPPGHSVVLGAGDVVKTGPQSKFYVPLVLHSSTAASGVPEARDAHQDHPPAAGERPTSRWHCQKKRRR